MPALRVLCTVGPGFLGSHLCERLVAEGHEVVCLENFFIGTGVLVQRERDDRLIFDRNINPVHI